MNRSLFVILFLALGLTGFGQNKLTGFAPDFLGKKVVLYTYQDYVSQSRIEIGEGTVNPADSTFEITYNTNSTIKGVIEIDRTESSLYLAPNTDYEVYFPKSVEPASYKNAETNLYFNGLDTTDINFRILQYHQWFDMYISYHQEAVAKGGFRAHLDTFKLYAADAYKNYDDPFFITYVRYDIAEMEQTYGGNRKSETRLKTYLEYIESFPVYHENDRYMKFILAFYDKEFREYLPVTEEAIWGAIQEKSPTKLMRAMKGDILLAAPELRELIMIDKLGKAFYREIELRPNIIAVLDSIESHSVYQENASVARNIKSYITSLEPGYPAPAIEIEKAPEEFVIWQDYKGRYVYFNFFAAWNEESVQDMEIIHRLVTEYGQDISFLSVSTDPDKATFDAFMKEHPEYDWDIYHIGEDQALMNAYKVANVPSYYLIDQEGFISAAPAMPPSPNGEYESIESIFFKIKEALHPKPRIGVGR